ncbi:conserved Plasmodium protein, unknown function [Plasmodium relictum]|uniref:Uncharacterized protein n=1 Tax=Plasmodium relictum TaxID=85471 RepID=A0A1J1H488_PLARL|nr:conserved Plasmodium protein, unknown function [Plasmodium relictum]CRG99385.1 conserved Plasmodium protein, unknown function [Plasmodium relictum]
MHNMEFMQKNEFSLPASNIDTNENPNIDMETDIAAFQQIYKERHKDINYDKKKKNSCRILNNITKYCCNINQVDSFNFNKKYNDFLREEACTTADIISNTDKLEQKSNDNNFLCKDSFSDKNQIKHKDTNESLKLTSEFKKEYKDIYRRPSNKNKIRNLVYSPENPVQVIKKNSYFNQNVSFIHNGRKIPNNVTEKDHSNIYQENETIKLGISNANENVKSYMPNSYVNKKYINNKKLENILKPKSFENLNSIKTGKNEYLKNNKMSNKKIFEEKENHVNKKKNTINEEARIYNLIKGGNICAFKEKKNDTHNKIILNKYKTLLHTDNGKNEDKKSEQVLKNSSSSFNEYSKNEINSSCSSINKRNKRNKIKRINLNVELLNFDNDVNLTLSNGAFISEKNNQNNNYSITSLSELKTRERPLLVDNFSQTIKKKKKFITIKKSKIRRKMKKTKKFKLKKKISNKNKLELKKKKSLKSRYVKYRTNNNLQKNAFRNKKKKKKNKIVGHYINGKKKKINNFSIPCSSIYTKKLVRVKMYKDISSKTLDIGSRKLSQFNASNGDNNSRYSSRKKKNSYLNIEKCDDENSKRCKDKIKSYGIEEIDKMHNLMPKSIKNVEVDNINMYNINKKFIKQKLSNICRMNSNVGIKGSNMENSCINKLLIKNAMSNVSGLNFNNKKNDSSCKVINFKHKNSEFINFKENFINSKDERSTFGKIEITHTNVNNQNKKCNYNDKIKSNIIRKLKYIDSKFFNISQEQVKNYTHFNPLNNISLVEYKRKLSDIENNINNNSLLIGDNKLSLLQYKDKKKFHKKDDADTLMILQRVAVILNDKKKSLYTYNLDDKKNKKGILKTSSNLNEMLLKNLKFPEYEKYDFYCKEIKKKYIKSKSYDSFFNEKLLNKNIGNTNLIKEVLSKKRNSKDNNNLLFHENLLQQRSIINNKRTFENHVSYILNSIVFYSNKLKNMLNISIKRRNGNEHTLEVKLFILCIIYLIEKYKLNTCSVKIEKILKLISEIIEKIRYYILDFPNIVDISKFELAIIKIYFIELLKMSGLLCSIDEKKLGGKYFFYSTLFSDEDFTLMDKVEIQGNLTNVIPVKREINVLNNLNTEFSDMQNLRGYHPSSFYEKKTNAFFKKGRNESNKHKIMNSGNEENIELKIGNILNEDKYNKIDLKEINIVSSSESRKINVKNNFDLEENKVRDINEKKNNNFVDIHILMKKLKKNILKLQLENHDKVNNLTLLIRYLDKLNYIYKINNAIFLFGENEKNIMNETKEMLEKINEKILKEKNESFDIEILIPIKKIKEKLDECVFSFLSTSFGKNSYSYSNISKYNDDKYSEEAFLLLKKERFNEKRNKEKFFTEENNNKNPVNCVDKAKLMCCNNDEKVLNKKNNFYNIDETKELQELNDYLNVIILKKNEQILKKPNEYYSILKKYHQELSLINQIHSNDNTLVKDFLDNMNIYKFSKLLNFYVKKKHLYNKFSKKQNFDNSEMYQKNNGIIQILYDFLLDSEKDFLEMSKYKSFFKNLPSMEKINKNMYYSFSDDKLSDANKHISYDTLISDNEIKFSKTKSMEFQESNNNIEYFKIYS